MWGYTGKGQRTTVGVVCLHVDPRDQMCRTQDWHKYLYPLSHLVSPSTLL